MSNKKHLDLIASNIEQHVYHIYLISDKAPEFNYLYTIGLTEKIGTEIIIAGWVSMSLVEQSLLMKSIVSESLENISSTTTTNNIINMTIGKPISKSNVKKLNLSESFIKFQEVDSFWIENLMFGAIDYYKNDDIKVVQVIPADKNLSFFTIPDMSLPLNKSKPSIWIDYFKEDAEISYLNNDYWWVDNGV